MLIASLRAPLLLTHFLSAAAPAQPRASPCEATVRRIDVRTKPPGELPELCISAGVSTTLLFYGAELLPGGVTAEGHERFSLVDPAGTTLRLIPSEQVLPGDRLRLTVRFKGEDAPSGVAFWLVVYPGQVERWVEVYRQTRTVESLQEEVKDKSAQLRQCREDVVRLLAEQKGPGGLAGLFAAGTLDENGVTSSDISRTINNLPKNALRVISAVSYRSATSVAVSLVFDHRDTVKPLQVASVELVTAEGRPLKVKPPWPTGPITVTTRLFIEAEATEAETHGSFTLKLWNEDRTRSVIVSGVTFP